MFDDNTTATQTATNDCQTCEAQGLVTCELDGSCAETEAECPQSCADVTDPTYGFTLNIRSWEIIFGNLIHKIKTLAPLQVLKLENFSN